MTEADRLANALLVPGIGPAIAESVAKYFAETANRDVCRRLAAAGVSTRQRGPRAGRGPLAGKTFVLTSALRSLPRDAAAEWIRRKGGRVADRVSRRTDYVVVGAAPGAKLARARALAVPARGEDALLALGGGAMSTAAVDFEAARRHMVDRHLAGRGIRDRRVLAAMAAVPRERFIDPGQAPFAYDDGPLPIGEGQTISQPYIVARMIEALGLAPTDRVLEIGTGSGYAAAVLAELAAEVYTMERMAALADRARRRLVGLGYVSVHVRAGDGTLGWPEHAPYDAIVATAGGPSVPPALLEQLAPGGRLVMPVGSMLYDQRLVRVVRAGPGEDRREELEAVAFVPLIGAQGWPEREERQ